jgi:hypothetical protein
MNVTARPNSKRMDAELSAVGVRSSPEKLQTRFDVEPQE